MEKPLYNDIKEENKIGKVVLFGLYTCVFTQCFSFFIIAVRKQVALRSTVLNNCDVYGLVLWDFSGGSGVNNSPANAGDVGSISCQEDPLEKEMAIHCNSLAWEISWTEKPGSLQSTGLQKSWAQISN